MPESNRSNNAFNTSRSNSSKSTGFGVIVTIVWLIFTLWIAISYYDKSIEINQWGDFLAGMAGPLALLWLILGYFQQRVELSQNTQALMLQHSELIRAVEEQEKLAKTTSIQTGILTNSNRAYVLPKVEIIRVDENGNAQEYGVTENRDYIDPCVTIVNYGSVPARDVKVEVHYHPLVMRENMMMTPERKIKSHFMAAIFSPGEIAEPGIDGAERRSDLIQAPKGSPDRPDYVIWIRLKYKNLHGYPEAEEIHENLVYLASMNIVRKKVSSNTNALVSTGVNVDYNTVENVKWLQYPLFNVVEE